MELIRFGPAGNSQSFYSQGYKSSVDMPKWLHEMGLGAYEYQCTKGVRIGRKTSENIGKSALENDIFLSIHAPYYINMASTEKIKREKSIQYILDTLKVARWMNAKRIVIHTGSCSRVERKWALDTAIEVLKDTIREADNLGLSDVSICPETLGKINQLGTLDEILTMCKTDEKLIPTVDFGHLYARRFGELKTTADFEKILDKIENRIGNERLRYIHIHFSRIEYGKSGEKKHRRYDEEEYGPTFDNLAEAMYKKNMEPVVICESREFMAEDAVKLKNIYNKVSGSNVL